MNNIVAARTLIQQLTDVLEDASAITTDMREFTDHFFAPGVYLRTLFIPKGHIVVGAIHKSETINILLKGKISVMDDQGGQLIAQAPFIFTAKPGQKVGYAIEDVWYANIFPNTENIVNIKQLEDEHTVPSLDKLESLL